MAINNFIDRIKIGNSTDEIAIGSSAYGECDTAAGNATKTVNIPGFVLNKGTTIHVKFIHANTASDPTLNVSNTGNIPLRLYGTTAMGGTASTTGWNNNAILTLTYDGSGWIRDQGYNTNSTYTLTEVWCNTAAGTKDKTFSNASYYTANDKSYFEITFRYTNTAQSALTLNGKELYIDGKATSSSNYTLPAGKYLVYYENGIYYIRTDGKITGDITGNAATVNGLTVQTAVPPQAVFTDTNQYHTSGSWSGLTYTATAVNDADELKFTIPDSYGDTKNPYGEKAKNLVLAGPSSGSNAAPSFRALVAADIPDISGTYIKKVTSTDNAIVRFDGTSGAIQDSKVTISNNGTITLPTEQDINFRMNRKQVDGGGWTHAYLKWYDKADNIFARIGVYGGSNTLTYLYLGTDDYNSQNNLRIAPDGTISGKLFSGSGASLTSLNASNLSSGTVPVARLPLATTSAAGAVKIGSGISVSDGTISVSAANLGLSSALRYQGTTTTVMSDGLTTAAVTINDSSYTPSAGDVVIYSDAEYLWTGALWELLGAESSFKKVQTAVSSSSASGSSATTFVSSVTQDTQGVITVTTSTLDTSETWSGTATSAETTADTSDALYVVGVTSSATTTLKHDTSVTVTGGAVSATTYNGLTLTAASTGFTIAGGSTTSKTLTVNESVTLKAGSSTYLAYYNGNNVLQGHSLAHFSDEFGDSVKDKKNELVLGNETGKASNGSSWGQLALYSSGTKGTCLKTEENSTAWYTATLPAKTGTIAYTSDVTASRVEIIRLTS